MITASRGTCPGARNALSRVFGTAFCQPLRMAWCAGTRDIANLVGFSLSPRTRGRFVAFRMECLETSSLAWEKIANNWSSQLIFRWDVWRFLGTWPWVVDLDLEEKSLAKKIYIAHRQICPEACLSQSTTSGVNVTWYKTEYAGTYIRDRAFDLLAVQYWRRQDVLLHFERCA